MNQAAIWRADERQLLKHSFHFPDFFSPLSALHIVTRCYRGRDTWGVTVVGPGETLAHRKTPPCSLSGAARQTITPPPSLARLSVTSPQSWQTDLQLQVAQGRTVASRHHYYNNRLREQLENTWGTQTDLLKYLLGGIVTQLCYVCVLSRQTSSLRGTAKCSSIMHLVKLPSFFCSSSFFFFF